MRSFVVSILSAMLMLLLAVVPTSRPTFAFLTGLRRGQMALRTTERVNGIFLENVNENGGASVEMVSLEKLGEDFLATGEEMAASVAAWLDEEWLKQEIHVKMGVRVKNVYVKCRSRGVDDVSQIMIDISDDLYENWEEFNRDAFVNAWDVSNYCADWMITKAGSETCECSTKIVE